MTLPAGSRSDFNSSESIDMLKLLLSKVPGVARVFVLEQSSDFRLRVRCVDITAVEALARSGGLANGRVTVHGSDSARCGETGDATAVCCEFQSTKMRIRATRSYFL